MIDLHIHSCFSEDGQYSPEELVAACAQAGVTVMSIADHNCTKANRPAQAMAEKNGIRYIPGIEVDCTFAGVGLHVLGYGIDPESHHMKALEENVARQNTQVSQERLRKTQALGFAITEDELRALSGGSYWPDSWPGEMFAEVLLAKPEYAGHPMLEPYRPGGARGDNPYVNFYWDFYAPGKPCYALMEYPALLEALERIHSSGGKAVLAHPGINLKGKEKLLDSLLAEGLDGIEAFSSYHTPEQAAFYYDRAKARGLFATCGSDFHGKTKPAVKLGGYGGLPEGFKINI